MTSRICDIDVLLGERLAALRQLRNRTCYSLSRELGIERTTLYRYEVGTFRIPASRLLLIARALDFPVSAFFDGIAATEETAHAA